MTTPIPTKPGVDGPGGGGGTARRFCFGPEAFGLPDFAGLGFTFPGFMFAAFAELGLAMCAGVFLAPVDFAEPDFAELDLVAFGLTEWGFTGFDFTAFDFPALGFAALRGGVAADSWAALGFVRLLREPCGLDRDRLLFGAGAGARGGVVLVLLMWPSRSAAPDPALGLGC